MEKYVTSLELSMKLDKLIKDKKGTMFYWCEELIDSEIDNEAGHYITYDWMPIIQYNPIKNQRLRIVCRAYLTDELAEMLPNQSRELTIKLWKMEDVYWISYSKYDEDIHLIGGEKSLPEAIGLMLEYLLVNNLI
jgi:hypothetical protein